MKTMTDKDYQCEDDLRCLMQAEEVKRDSKRLKAAMKLAKEKMKDLSGVKQELSQGDIKEDKEKTEKSEKYDYNDFKKKNKK